MKVFKFGGASVNSVERIQNLAGIVRQSADVQLVIIVSAMGKTTNALEKVAAAFFAGNKEEALQLFDAVKHQHINTAKYLLVTRFNACLAQMTDFFTEVEWLLHDKPVREFDYYYDQIVCAGELLSTCIISHYLDEAGVSCQWLDVRDLIRTDNNFRDAGIDWEETAEKIKTAIAPTGTIYITQGFIGSTDDNESTTLGREGSDYSAAVFANILEAESLTIWKDVEGVMNADPKEFPEAELIAELNFNEVIEMAFYGAQVIHPKTIKPLQNKGIPLLVKCFLDPSLPGTIIHKKTLRNLPPIIVIKRNQALLHLKSRDFSFVGDEPMSRLYQLFGKLKIKPTLIQTGAISVQVCMDDHAEKIAHFASDSADFFDLQVEKNLNILTIRHFNETVLGKYAEGKNIVLSQRTRETIQIIYA
jgi:aspartate kinase